MNHRIWTHIKDLKGLLQEQPDRDNHTVLMFGALEALEQLLRTGRSQDPHSERLISSLHKDAGSLLHKSGAFLATLAEIEGDLVASPMAQPEPPDKLSHVYFLSYARDDARTADRIERLLQDKERLVWRDIRDLGPGDDCQDTIVVQVVACSSFVALHSAAYARSDYCKGELNLALQNLRTGLKPYRVVLLRLDDAYLPLNYGDRIREWARTPEEQSEAVRRLLRYESAHSHSN